MEKIKILFNELQKKYPEVLDEQFVTSILESINSIVESDTSDIKKELEDSKEEIETLKAKIEEDEKEDKDKDKKGDVGENTDTDDETEEKMKEELERIINTLDVFCNEAFKEFTSENKEIIEKSIKTNIPQSFLEGVTNLLDELHCEFEPKTKHVIETLKEDNSNLRKELKELQLKESQNNLNFQKKAALEFVSEAIKDLNDDDSDTFGTLIENFEIDDINVFKKNVINIKSLFTKRNTHNVNEQKVKIEDFGNDSPIISESNTNGLLEVVRSYLKETN